MHPYLKMPGLKASRVAWELVHAAGDETKEINLADRGQRLQQLCESEVWKLDLLPILSQLWDETLDGVRDKSVDADALVVLEAFLSAIHSDLVKGFGAMSRVAEKRARLAEASAVANNGHTPNIPPLPPRA